MSRHYPSSTSAEAFEFYKGAKPCPELQDKLNLMQGWDAKRLAAAVPAWAKPKMLPAAFKPQLSQKLPDLLTRHGNPHPAALFAGLPQYDMVAYVAAWNSRNGYVAESA